MRRPRNARLPRDPVTSTIEHATPGAGGKLDPLSQHRERALVSLASAREPTLVRLEDLVTAYMGVGSVRLGSLLPFQNQDGVTRKPTVWVATLRKLRLIVRAALPGDIVLCVRRNHAHEFLADSGAFDFGAPPWVLSDMLTLSRWLTLEQMTALERRNVQLELLSQDGTPFYQVKDGSYFDHGRNEANRDLTRMSLVSGTVAFYRVRAATIAESHSKGILTREYQRTYPPAAQAYSAELDHCFLDGGLRTMPNALVKMDVLQHGKLVVHPVTNERGVKFWSWFRRETTFFNDQMIDPRELAIMGQHNARWVLYQLGFPMGLETDEYLSEMGVRMKYLIRKGWGHLKVRDKQAMVETARALSREQREIDENLVYSHENDARLPSAHSPTPTVVPVPREYGKLRRKRGQRDLEEATPVVLSEFPLTRIE